MKSNTALSKPLISIDVFTILVLTPAFIDGQNAFLTVVALLAYLLISLGLPLGTTESKANSADRLSFVLRFTLLLTIVTSAVIVPTVGNYLERLRTPVEKDGYSDAYRDLSDSGLQMELALGYLDSGRNPYAESYEDTPLRFYQWSEVGIDDWHDPAYDYFVYFPGTLLISYPFYSAAISLNILYDQRIFFLIIYSFVLFIIPQLTDVPEYKLALISAVGLNPLITDSVMLGMNDIAPLAAIVFAVLAITRHRFLMAAFFLGTSCALKQYSWFVVPFFLFFLWEHSNSDRRWRDVLLASFVIGALVFLASLPFVLWDLSAFYTDTIAFPAGRTPLLYPIRGYSIGRLLMGTGIIPTFVSEFPFYLLQALFGIPLFFLLLWFQHGKEFPAMLLSSSIFIFSFGFLSRFFHQNYLGVVISLASLGILLDFSRREHRLAQERDSNP